MNDKRSHFTTPDETMQHKRWILVAHQAGAKILASQNGSPLSLIERIPNPIGHAKNNELGSDQPGRSFDSVGGGRHAMSNEVDAHEQNARTFALRLCEVIEKGRAHNKYRELVLVAGPKFLGHLKAGLDKNTLKSVTQTIEKDFAKTTDDDLVVQLKELLF